MTAGSKSLFASLTAPKLPDSLFAVTDIDAELSKVREAESDFIAADFPGLSATATTSLPCISRTVCSKATALQPVTFQNAHSLTVFSMAVIYQTAISPRAISELAPLPRARLSGQLSKTLIIKMSALTAAVLNCRTFNVQSCNRYL